MAKFAAQTKVSAEQSRGEIENILKRYGATAFASGWKGVNVSIGFEMHQRRYRIDLVLPRPDDESFCVSPKRIVRTAKAAQTAYAQAVRQRWRALALVIKAKLEAVDSGIVTIENEFLSYAILPDGRTMREWAAEELTTALAAGSTPRLLPESCA